MAERGMTLIRPCTGPGNSHPRKGHSRGEPLPPFSNSVGMEIERAWGNFTINQSSASLPRRQREAGSQMTNPFPSPSRNYCWGVMPDQREPPFPPPVPSLMGYLHIDCLQRDAIYEPPERLQVDAEPISNTTKVRVCHKDSLRITLCNWRRTVLSKIIWHEKHAAQSGHQAKPDLF